RPRSDDPLWLVERRGDTADVFIGTEAVLIGDGMVQHLNPTAAAIHLLFTEGRPLERIARDLDLGLEEIEEVLRSIR
ncbi:MAG TPA: hypothetical protein VMW08_17060, partial [Acidimicrobiales bacterium]|nr:hypothetical protein [Acidimicrobiales bacterium]